MLMRYYHYAVTVMTNSVLLRINHWKFTSVLCACILHQHKTF